MLSLSPQFEKVSKEKQAIQIECEQKLKLYTLVSEQEATKIYYSSIASIDSIKILLNEAQRMNHKHIKDICDNLAYKEILVEWNKRWQKICKQVEGVYIKYGIDAAIQRISFMKLFQTISYSDDKKSWMG
tara:strand:+ start:5735 stop:6124 length:390 start_codon:yes stop_codon:yes gene_type:complete